MTSKWAGDYERAVLLGDGADQVLTGLGEQQKRAIRSCKPDSWNKTVRL